MVAGRIDSDRSISASSPALTGTLLPVSVRGAVLNIRTVTLFSVTMSSVTFVRPTKSISVFIFGRSISVLGIVQSHPVIPHDRGHFRLP
ncbi:hypothetical protein D3C87_1902980 [compost metagenome]